MSRSICFLRILILAIAAAIFVVPMLPASATTFPAHGFPGSTQRPAVCKEGSYLVGFRGRVGNWVDSIGLICAPALEGGRLGKKDKKYALHGGKGGSPTEVYCGPNEIVTSFLIIILGTTKTLVGVDFTCFAIGGQTPNVRRFAGALVDEARPPVRQTCPPGEVATGAQINYGKHVNGLGLICEELVIPAATQPTPPPAEVVASFAGVWDTVAAGQNITLILEVNGSDVSGYFGYTNDPQKDGNLRGTLQSPGEFLFTYQQNNGEAGSGGFRMSGNGNKIVGVAASNGVQVPWTGSRRP